MKIRIWLYIILYKAVTTIVAQEFQMTVYGEINFKGSSIIWNVTGCTPSVSFQQDWRQWELYGLASVNTSGTCSILYNYDAGNDCSSEEFAIIPANDPVALDITELRFNSLQSSFSRCNYCPTKIIPTTAVQAYSFFVSDNKTASGRHFNTAEFNTENKANICGQILDELPIHFFKVGSGCVQFYASNDCTTAKPEINKFQAIHGVRKWDVQKPVKSFSHCFFHCASEMERNYVGVRGRYVEEEEPAISGIRVSLSSGQRENLNADELDERFAICHEAPGKIVSTVTRVVAKDICILLYSNINCNKYRTVSKPTVLEAMGQKIAAIDVPDINLPHVKSYMLCKTLTRFEDYDLVLAKTNFFKNYATTDTIRIFNSTEFIGIGQILNITGCSVLPHPLASRSSIDSYGKCILFFSENNCTGHFAKLAIGSPVLRDTSLIDSIESYQSVQFCSNKAQLTTELDLHYSFTITTYGFEAYNWTFSSLANQSAICWELPYYHRSSILYQKIVVTSGCFKVFVGLECSPFSQHFTVTSSNKGPRYLHEWGSNNANVGSFTSCADLVTHPRIDATVPRQSMNATYNFPRGTAYVTKLGEIGAIKDQNGVFGTCLNIPWNIDSKTIEHDMDELSSMFVNDQCIFVCDELDCTMSDNTTLPILLNVTDGPLEINLMENPFWGKSVSVVSTIPCKKFISEYNALGNIYRIEMERQRATNSTGSTTTIQTIYIASSAMLWTLLAIVVILVLGLGFVIYFKVKNSQINKLSKVELDVFFNGSDELATSNEDAIQNTAVNKTLEIPSTSFTYVKSNDGTPVVLGSGCFGKVIRGILHTGFDELNNCQLTKDVAIKIPRIGITLEQIRSLLCEIKICSFVGNHKNIVEFIGFCVEDIRLGKVSILLELCENGSLLQFLRDNVKDFQNNCRIEIAEQTCTGFGARCNDNETFEYFRLLRWCQEIAEGMEFLSSKNVLHADLATRNCLLDSELQIKITDFGLSRKLYDYGIYTKESQAKLPRPWMALESLKSFTFSVKTDVWSYGVCLWEIFSFGDTPYPTLTWDENIKHLSAGLRLSKPELCPEYCYQLMLKCWHEDPNERYDFMELRKAISDFRQELFGNKVENDNSGLYTVLE